MDSGASPLRSESWLDHLLAVLPWEVHLTSVCFPFLLCEIRANNSGCIMVLLWRLGELLPAKHSEVSATEHRVVRIVITIITTAVCFKTRYVYHVEMTLSSRLGDSNFRIFFNMFYRASEKKLPTYQLCDFTDTIPLYKYKKVSPFWGKKLGNWQDKC